MLRNIFCLSMFFCMGNAYGSQTSDDVKLALEVHRLKRHTNSLSYQTATGNNIVNDMTRRDRKKRSDLFVQMSGGDVGSHTARPRTPRYEWLEFERR